MHHINGAHTNYFNTKRKRAGHLFQERYKALLINIDEYSIELSRYIHLNSVKARMAEKPEEYKWSSYKNYIGIDKSPDWLFTDFLPYLFDINVSVEMKEY